jgi:hypothetical protein
MRRPALATGAVVLVIAGIGLTASHHSLRSPVAPAVAIQDVRSDPTAAQMLRSIRWSRVAAAPLDATHERVTFFAGDQIVAEASVSSHGRVEHALSYLRRSAPYGNQLAYEPSVLIGFGLLFVLMAGVAPWRRVRNLDVLAALSLLAPVILLQHRYVDASVLSATPGLVYLSLRCLWIALGHGVAAPRPSASVPLFDAVTAVWKPAQRARLLRGLLAATALVFLMVGVSSTGAVDVVFAVMEGATKLIHGVLPYGHMPGDIVHGDTYPILSYAFYAPVALISPVSSTWDLVDGGLAVAVLAALASAAAVGRMTTGRGVIRAITRSAGADTANLRSAVAFLSFPTLLITVSTGTTDVVLGALVMCAVVVWHRPGRSAALIATAGCFKLAPFALLPIWLAPLRGRRLVLAVLGVGAVLGATLALLVGVGGAAGVSEMLRAVSFQLNRGSPQSLWAVLGVQWLQPLAQALVLALIAGAAVRLGASRDLASDRVRIAALTAAIMIALQLAADYWAFLYASWVAPLVVLTLLADVEAKAVVSEPEAAPAGALEGAPAFAR